MIEKRWRKTAWGLVLAVVLALASAGRVPAGVRCGGGLVTEGDTQYEARQKCGEPNHIESWEEERILREYARPRAYDDSIYRRREGYREPLLVKETIRIEVWTYDWGSSRLLHYLRFENGRLTEISTGGYGN